MNTQNQIIDLGRLQNILYPMRNHTNESIKELKLVLAVLDKRIDIFEIDKDMRSRVFGKLLEIAGPRFLKKEVQGLLDKHDNNRPNLFKS